MGRLSDALRCLLIQVARVSELRFVVLRARWDRLESLKYRDGTVWRVTEVPDQVHTYGVHFAQPNRTVRPCIKAVPRCCKTIASNNCFSFIRVFPSGNGYVEIPAMFKAVEPTPHAGSHRDTRISPGKQCDLWRMSFS